MSSQCPHTEQTYHFGRGSQDAEHQKHQADISRLLDGHVHIKRQVTLLDNGFYATTTSDEPSVAQALQTHVVDMKMRFAKGRAIRSWDQVYALLFAYRAEITVDYTLLPDGVRSEVTTQNPVLVELLHAHAHAVSGFAAKGREVSGLAYPLSEALENLPLHPHDTSISSTPSGE
jgi:hypothetical protein